MVFTRFEIYCLHIKFIDSNFIKYHRLDLLNGSFSTNMRKYFKRCERSCKLAKKYVSKYNQSINHNQMKFVRFT